MSTIVNFGEVIGLYGSSIELSLRAGKAVQKGAERLVREHLAYVESAAGQLASVTGIEQPKDITAVQTVFEKAREQFTATAKRVLEIQEDVGAELKAVVEEGVTKFSPVAVTKLFKAA
ncbi:MAG: phasin family protein [Chromatiales bacterium]